MEEIFHSCIERWKGTLKFLTTRKETRGKGGEEGKKRRRKQRKREGTKKERKKGRKGWKRFP